MSPSRIQRHSPDGASFNEAIVHEAEVCGVEVGHGLIAYSRLLTAHLDFYPILIIYTRKRLILPLITPDDRFQM
jgi:hypothetical protein